MRVLNKILLLSGLVLAASLPSHAQQFQFTAPDCEFAFRFAVVNNVITAPSRIPTEPAQVGPVAQVTAGYDNRYKNCVTWTMMYHVDGPSALSIELDEAPTSGGVPGSWVTWPSSFVAPGTALPLTTTVASQVSTFTYFPWISVILNSATGSGQIEGHVYGWRAAPGQDASVAGNATTVAGYNRTAITTATNTQIKATSGVVHTITISQPGATGNSITLVDTAAANCTGGTTLMTIPTAQLASTMAPVTLTLDVATTLGICIITAGTTSPQLLVSSR